MAGRSSEATSASFPKASTATTEADCADGAGHRLRQADGNEAAEGVRLKADTLFVYMYQTHVLLTFRAISDSWVSIG
jgi:hypothetical protein